MSRQIVVLGMHRSGTSMVAGILQLLGVHMGTFRGHSAAAATRHTPEAYFEDRAFSDLNIAVMNETGAGTFDMLPQSAFDKVEGFERDMVELVQQRDAEYELWGFKDPRTLLVWSHWCRYLSSPLLVLTTRSEEAILQSMSHRTLPSAEKARQTLERYGTLFRRLLIFGPREYIVLPYERILRHPEVWVGKLCKVVGVSLCQEAIEYVDSRKDHFVDEA